MCSPCASRSLARGSRIHDCTLLLHIAVYIDSAAADFHLKFLSRSHVIAVRRVVAARQ